MCKNAPLPVSLFHAWIYYKYVGVLFVLSPGMEVKLSVSPVDVFRWQLLGWSLRPVL